MRDQYAGDVSDVLKFAFLRALAGADGTLGIAWHYAPGETSQGARQLPARSIAALEKAAIWPTGALFHREPVPPRVERSAWGVRKRSALKAADTVFLDPDNGIGAETEKHATFSEIRLLRRPGRAIVFISFPGQNMTHDALLQRLREQTSSRANERIRTMSTCGVLSKTAEFLALSGISLANICAERHPYVRVIS